MKPYKTIKLDNYPDVADIHLYGRKSSSGNLQGKGGDIRSLHKNPNKKQAARRAHKRSDKAKSLKEENKNEFIE